MTAMTRWKLSTRAVNSKLLADEVHEFVVVGMEDTGVNWSSDVQRDAFVEMLDEFFGEVADDGKIEQWDVRCDARNNSAKAMAAGKHILEIRYKQRNCLNVTELRYDIVDESQGIQLDFDDLNF